MANSQIEELKAIINCSDDAAATLLQIANGDLMQAMNLYFDNPDIVNSVRAAPASRSNQARGTSSGNAIQIDSDDEGDDVQVLDSDDDMSFGNEDAAAVARNAQEEEDAAMAKRLQEELYGGGGAGGQGASGGDDVRAPIARTTETLMAPSYGYGEDDMDNAAAVMEQLRRRQHRRSMHHPYSTRLHDANCFPDAPQGAFGQDVWADEGDRPPTAAANDGAQSRSARLADLYRPPRDLISHLSWDESRQLGREDKKWILVNIQDLSDFNCQILNRDIWKDDAIRAMIQDSFIFLQYTKDDLQAMEYIQFYMHGGQVDNPDNYPHVAIVDPRTGEQVKVWAGRPFPSAPDFHAQLAEFLDRYSLEAYSKNPVAQSKPAAPAKDFDRMTEEEMLEMALQNSMNTANGGSSSAGPSIHDPDSLTTADKKMDDAPEPAAEEPKADSPFSRISSTNAHTEPDNNPATTTRIQFRHANGRVIRRFALDDRVIRLFEWLKAEPLEGKEGKEFELKTMPAGADLLEQLDKTIEEAGLKQATVMVEYIED